MYLKNLRPEIYFIVFASFFGLIILLITPPFQAPDEINHFYRAYQISEGNFMAVKQNNRLGGDIPVSLVKITEPFLGLIGNMHAKTNYKIVFEQFSVPLNSKDLKFVDFPNTAMYSPVSYVPQAMSMFVLRTLKLPPLYIFYGARLFTLICWILILFFTIRAIPFYKWFYVFIALLPMSVFINMSLSADVVTNMLSFFLVVYILRLAYADMPFTKRNFLIIAFLTILLASAKLVYSPLIMLLFLLPRRNFLNKKAYYIQLISLFLIALGTVVFWLFRMDSSYLPYSIYNAGFRDSVTMTRDADMHKQMEYIFHHGFHLWYVFINSAVETFDMYFQGYIGTFGWLDTFLPMWFIYGSYVVLFFVALAGGSRNITIKPLHKSILFLSFIVLVCLILLSQHLTWDAVGCDIIYTIQGRYFIPVFPLLFMLLYNAKFSYPKIVIPLVIAFSFASLSFTSNALYNRYYNASEFKTVSINCDSETVDAGHGFKTNIPSVFLGNSNTQSREKAKSGAFSSKLTSKNQVGFTYPLRSCLRGDIINVGVWRFGTTGSIIISGEIADLYIGPIESVEKDSSGWEHLLLSCTVRKNLGNKEISIFIYNSSNDSSYFDDMVIEYHKFQ
ncbi:MAG: DUF2142 domain-containing protein [Bacteroidales bacterium]